MVRIPGPLPLRSNISAGEKAGATLALGPMSSGSAVSGMDSGAMMPTLRHVSVSVIVFNVPPDLKLKSPFKELPCASQPPPILPGEGTERNYGIEVTTYRCPNGYEWSTGQWPYLEVECLNKKWSRNSLPDCRSKCEARHKNKHCEVLVSCSDWIL